MPTVPYLNLAVNLVASRTAPSPAIISAFFYSGLTLQAHTIYLTRRSLKKDNTAAMAFRLPLRRLALARPATVARGFHSTPRVLVKVGDEVPSLELFEKSAATKINLADEFKKGDGYIVGVPAAFSGTCSATHIPSYINHPNLKSAGQVFVVAVNDPFV